MPLPARRSAARLASALAGALFATSAVAADPGPDNLVLACTGAFARDSDARRVAAAFGAASVKEEDVAGAEGETFGATVIFPDDPARRVEIAWADEAGRRRPASIRLAGETSRWTLEGVALGSDLAAVARVNGKPLAISGFDWDYGGLVTSWNGGALGVLAGGCSAQLGFGVEGDVLRKFEGDGVTLRSTDKALLALKPKVVTLGIGWAQEP